jgi:Uma2 family endonuclease
MLPAQVVEKPVSFHSFLALLDARGGEARLELIEGEVVATPDSTEDHEQIAAYVFGSLKPAMDARGCRSFAGGMLVRKPDRDDIATAPDVVVRCRSPLGSQRFIEDPVIVVEVLSPSTMDEDRGPKLMFYKSLPTLRHVALVYQDEWRIETWDRAGDVWSYRALTAAGDALSLTWVDHAVPLRVAYAGTGLASRIAG